MNKIIQYAQEHGHNGKYLFTIRELADTGLLKPVKSSNSATIAQAIREGKLKAFISVRNGRNIYHIPVEAVIKFYKLRERELKKSPISCAHRAYARRISRVKAVKYLLDRGYKQIDIARCLGVSRQRVNQLIN